MEFSAKVYGATWKFREQGLPADLMARWIPQNCCDAVKSFTLGSIAQTAINALMHCYLHTCVYGVAHLCKNVCMIDATGHAPITRPVEI